MQFLTYKTIMIGLISTCLSGCGFFVSNMANEFGENLESVILNHNDPDTVAEALPAYLLLLESMLISEPENQSLLLSTATLYGSYISLLTDDDMPRHKPLSNRARDYAFRAACVDEESFCSLQEKKYPEFEQIIKQTDLSHIDTLYTLGTTWASWIQSHKSDWNAIAQLAQVKLLMNRVIELDGSYKKGNAHIYLGVLATILPPALGGTPEVGKQYFETALKLSDQKNLMVKVIYAKQFARMMFDRQLHDELLNAVVNANSQQSDLTLMNALAKKQAKVLLESADDYF